MNISKEGLNFLIKVLPKMSFAQTVIASQTSGVELIGLLNIRTASSIQKSIFAAPVVDENVIEVDDSELEKQEESAREKSNEEEEVGLDLGSLSAVPDFNNYLKNLTKNRYLTSTKKKLENSLGEKAQKIIPKLDQFATPGEDFRVSSKAVKEFAKENDLNEKQTKLADAYVSLLRHEKGYLDTVITKVIANAAKNLTGDDISMFLPTQADAMNAIVTVLQLGRKTFNKSVLEGEVELKEGEEEKIEDYLNEVSKKTSSDNYVSANLIISTIKSRAKIIASIIKRSLRGVRSLGFKEFLNTFKSKNEDVKDLVDFLGSSIENHKGGSKSDWKSLVDSKNPDSWIKDSFEQAWNAYTKEYNKKSIKTESVDRPVQLDEGEGSMLETLITEEGAKKPDEKVTKSEAVSVLKKIKDEVSKSIADSIRNPNEAKAFLEAVKNAEETGVRAGQTEQYENNKELWKKYGINNFNDFRTVVKSKFRVHNWKERIKDGLEKELGKDYMQVLTSSKLSHQLLLRAVSNKRIKLASRISKINADMKEGNVKVYEVDNPQFSHEFYWKNEDNRIHIAEVKDIDEKHMDEAYQAAFDAVKQEVLINNAEILIN